MSCACAGPVNPVASGVKEAAREIDPRISLDLKLLSDQIARSLLQERLAAALAGAFGLLALTLAGAGLFGVVSYPAARGRGEIGPAAA